MALIKPSNLRQRSLAPLLERADLPHITFHDLRHTCASLLFQKNVHPEFVRELLGRASVASTLDTYSHMLPGMGNGAADALGEALDEPSLEFGSTFRESASEMPPKSRTGTRNPPVATAHAPEDLSLEVR